MTRLLVGDVGGTHARFARAQLGDDETVRLDAVRHLPVAGHASLEAALSAYRAETDWREPVPAAIAVAGAVAPGTFTLTNSGWRIDRARLAAEVGTGDVFILNDFEAVAHTLSAPGSGRLCILAGPPGPLPPLPVTVLGPGTGLGVAVCLPDGRVIPTEGGHIGFAPAGAAEMALLASLQPRFGRVSAERLASGPGLAAILSAQDAPWSGSEASLWAAALAGEPAAGAALDRWLSILGSVAGDLVLAHGAGALVLAGSLSDRLGDRLGRDPFLAAFRNKGRFADRMTDLPIRRIDQPEPGLTGAALAWAARRDRG